MYSLECQKCMYFTYTPSTCMKKRFNNLKKFHKGKFATTEIIHDPPEIDIVRIYGEVAHLNFTFNIRPQQFFKLIRFTCQVYLGLAIMSSTWQIMT